MPPAKRSDGGTADTDDGADAAYAAADTDVAADSDAAADSDVAADGVTAADTDVAADSDAADVADLVDTSPPDPADALVLDDERFESGTVALVTGAASGIGRAVATALVANGLTVVGGDVDGDGLVTVADALEGQPGRFVPAAGDLSDDDVCEALVEAAAAEGDLRFLANVAGLQHIDPIESFPMSAYDQLLDVMLRAPFLLSKLAFPHIRDAGGGAVANMASIHGHVATADKPAYVVAKFGLRGLTKALAAEGDGEIRAFSVSTSYVSTPLVTGQIPDSAAERGISEREVVADVMLGGSRVPEMMTPMAVANCFVFGLSRYGRHLNGDDLTFDGGHLGTYE